MLFGRPVNSIASPNAFWPVMASISASLDWNAGMASAGTVLSASEAGSTAALSLAAVVRACMEQHQRPRLCRDRPWTP